MTNLKGTIKDAFLNNVISRTTTSPNKVTIVGAGKVGMACAICLLTQNVSNDLVLVDVMCDKVKGEMMDLQYGAEFLNNPKISSGHDFCASAGSRLCIIAAGVRPRTDETYLDLLKRNTDIFKKIIPKIVKRSPNTILIIASNPVDILSYVAWKLSGFPINRIIGSGTNLDSSRFRFMISQRLGTSVASCHGWIIGEHGDSSVPVWSGVNVAGVRLREINPQIGTNDDPENWHELHKQVIVSGSEVRKLKNCSSWAIALSVSAIASDILRNTCNIRAVSTLVQGCHGIDKEVFLSLPCVISSNGVTQILKQVLTDIETKQLQKSADGIYKAQAGVNFDKSCKSCKKCKSCNKKF